MSGTGLSNPAPAVPAATRLVTFVGGDTGEWSVDEVRPVVGEALAVPSHLAVTTGPATAGAGAGAGALWTLHGVTSNDRYVERREKTALAQRQEGLGRADSTRAVLIPMRKTAAWWLLTQDERRHIFEAQSQHIAVGMTVLPAVARRLHHCRDLGADQPFDFLTWFEFAPTDEAAFDALLVAMRGSPEWAYVDREVEVRLRRASALPTSPP